MLDIGCGSDRDLRWLKQKELLVTGERMSPRKALKIIELIEEMSLTTVGEVDKKALRS